MTTPPRAAIYSRISQDSQEDGKGVERQEEDCEALIAKRGWDFVGIYRDNDISAAGQVKKERPRWNALLEDARNGLIDVIVAYSNSRLSRRPAEWLELINLAQTGKVQIATIASGQHDLTTADGRAVAMTIAIWDAAEAERTAERLKRQKAQRAAEGKAQGGRYRVYGYTRSWEVIEEEAAVVREAFTRRAAGESATAIANDLTARGFTTVTGRPWTQANLLKVLAKPGYAGLREYEGEIVAKTAYEPIIDEATFRAAQIEVTKDAKGTNARKHLLSGFLICSKCFTPMRGKNASGKRSYVCAKAAGGCGAMSIKMDWADEPITAAMFTHQQKTAPVDPEPETSTQDLQADIDAIDKRIEELHQAYSDKELTLPEMLKLVKGEKASRADLVKQQQDMVVTHWGLLQPFEEWEAMNLSQKRGYIERFISNVMVYPPKNAKGKNVQDNSRLEIHFADGTVQRLSNPTLRDRHRATGKA